MTDQEMRQSLTKAFIDRKVHGSAYDPRFIINVPKKNQYLLTSLQEDLDKCQDFFFSIAFITQAGLNGIKSHLADLHGRGIKGRLLTSDYLYFNHPDVFRSLLRIPNLEVRISNKEGFHSKGYLFNYGDHHSFTIGSSNLTMQALKQNYEWNIRLTSLDHGEIIYQMHQHMEEEWKEAEALSLQWIADYDIAYTSQPRPEATDFIQERPLSDSVIAPNKMQEGALASLKQIRAEGAERALVISATGTGKTYLAAFDVLNAQPDRMLFIVHREQILEDARDSFQRVLGGDKEDFGILSGNRKDLDAKYLFATIQTISKPEYQELFETDAFDYILIDEVHKAGAPSYQRTIDYFQPKFLLGMTATPERTDDFNIYALFDYNIAYEIRLQEALEEDMLAPFHYFGVTDYEKDGQVISETSTLSQLVNEERVDYLLDRIQYYGVSGNKIRGLVFCSRVDEARDLSQLFSERGYPSTYLSGQHSIEERERQIRDLEKGRLDYIFTVDIFNEGIDIPMVNQVIMLRNTESSIIFTQQLGRGLRKHPSKDFVTVIDFIGNYKNNYMIPMALTGDFSNNKDSLRKDTSDTNFISGLSTINFEEVAKERIFASIDQAKLDSMKEIREKYKLLKNRINRVPRLQDFQESQILDPTILATKLDHYQELLVTLKESDHDLSPEASAILKFISHELLPGHRLHELVLLEELLKHKNLALSDLESFFQNIGLPHDPKTIRSVLNILSTDFYRGGLAKSYQDSALIQVGNEEVKRSPGLEANLADGEFTAHLFDLLQTAQIKNEAFDNSQALTLYQKYRRRDVLRVLNWQEQMVDQNIGGYTYKDGKFINFITLHKGDDFQGSLVAYEDKFLDNQHLEWYTKAPRSLDSPEVKLLQNFEGWTFYQFLKKSDDEGTSFYYLGEATPLTDTIKQVDRQTENGKRSVVEMDLRLKTPVKHDLYRYLTNSLV